MTPAEAIARLSAAGCVAPVDEVDELLAAAACDDAEFARMVDERATGTPLAWVTGATVFCGERIVVGRGVYVPRWQTQALALRAAHVLPDDGVAVDLCTGSGAVAAVLQRRKPAATVVATELDPLAAACARANGVSVAIGSLDRPLDPRLAGEVDVMTAVVPYVPTAALGLLARDVVAHEPVAALDGGPQGLTVLDQVIALAPRWLRPGGSLLVEAGVDQMEAIAEAMDVAGFSGLAAIYDLDGDACGVEARVG